MKKSSSAYILLILISIFVGPAALAQRDSTELRKEVKVVKAYEPSISDAYKINDIPRINHEDSDKPTFDYQINSQPVFSTFTVDPVEAAQMAKEPKEKLGKGLIKGGIGNYLSSYGELFFNAETGRRSTFGMHFKHLSSNGKIKLLNTDKVDAPQSGDAAEIFTKHMFRKSTLSTSIYFDRKAFKYYGYTGDTLSNENKELLLPYWNAKQSFSKGGLNIKLASNNGNYDSFRYSTSLNYQVLGSKTGQMEHLAKLNGLFNKEFESFWGQLDAGLTYLHTDSIFNTTNNAFGIKQQIILKLNPSMLLEGDMASLRIGINSYSVMDDDLEGEYLLTPNVKASWSPIENTLTLFAGIDGYLEHNHYSAIATENRYVNPYQDIQNAKYQYILNGGIHGKFSPQVNYRFEVAYSSIANQHFYMLKETETLGNLPTEYEMVRSNTFDVLYDDCNELTIGGELHYAVSNEIDFLLNGKYFSYDMNLLETAWQKPNYEVSTSVNFNPEGPMHFTADIYMIGKRKALIQTDTFNPLLSSTTPESTSNTIVDMDPIIDLNLGIDYQYSPKLSFWGQVNNFSFKKYEYWAGYTNQGLTILAGASYSF